MSDNDPLDNEISVEAEISENGIKAKARSRFLSSIDRLFGNIFDLANTSIEEKLTTKRIRIDSRKKISSTAIQTIVRTVEEDPDTAITVLENELYQQSRRLENKGNVIKETYEQLKRRPPTEENAQNGDEKLDLNFLNRFERYAEDASTDEVRRKWASVLASEVRKPGTFDMKTLRVIDEISQEAANAFQKLCTHRIGLFIPVFLYDLDFLEANICAEYDLITYTSTGIVMDGSTILDYRNKQYFSMQLSSALYLFEVDDAEKRIGSGKKLRWNSVKKCPRLAVIPIAPVGASILNILDDNSIENAKKLLPMLREHDKTTRLMLLAEDGKTYQDTMI